MPTTLPTPGDPKAVYVLDLSGYVFRAYHALPPLSNSKGEPTHATLGVANMLTRLFREQKPHYLAVAMDTADETTFRKQIYPEYKSHRPPAPPDLHQQMERCAQLVRAYAVPILQQEGYEADDLIAACVREARNHGLVTVVCSADKDLMQLVAPDVIMWDAMRNRVYGPDEVKEKWGVGPEHVCDLLALMGDTSDNIPGVSGVGEKTAAKLVNEYGSLEGVLGSTAKIKGKLRENLEKDAENARLSYKLACLQHDLPVKLDLETLRYGGWDPKQLKALFQDLEFDRLAASVDDGDGAGEEKTEKAEKGAKRGRGEKPASTPQGTTPSAIPSTPPPAAGPTSAAEGKRYEAVLTEEALDAAIAACRKAGLIGLDTETTSIEAPRAHLVGISLAWEPHAGVYIPVGHRVLGDPPQIPREKVIEKVGPLLADASVKKTGHNIKYDDIVLRRAGAPVAGYEFDSMIASYLLDAERHSHKLDEVARTELNYSMIAYDTVTKKTKGSQLGFDEVDVKSAAQYAAEDADVALLLTRRLRPRIEEEGLWLLMRDVEIPLALVLSRMEEHGVLVDTALLKTISAEVNIELIRLEKELHAIAGKEFNVNSPRQLEAILFDELKLPVIKRTKTSRSTDHEVLDELSEKHPLPGKILEYRVLAKLKGTYLDALPELVNPATGRIHTSYAQAVAATGRLSSNNPNLQNIPIRSPVGRRIREAFIAPKGMSLFAADYSQIELRVLAHLSQDAILLDAFRKNEDIHTRTAMEIYKVPADQVTKPMRNRAKTTNFAVIYGQGDAALARQLGIERAEAAKFIETYFHTFPGLTRFLEKTVEQARAGEGVRTLLGRRRHLPTISSENRGLRAQAERIAKNTPIQGTAADIMKLAMVAVDQKLREGKYASRMILTVHDELVFEVPEDERARIEPMVRETMQGVMSLTVPLLVDVGWGRSWGEAH